jgi:hypothetical protein
MLVLGLIPDTIYFVYHLFLQRNDELSSEVVNVISPEAFNTLEAVVQREVKVRKIKNPRDPLMMKSQNLIKILRQEMEIPTCI